MGFYLGTESVLSFLQPNISDSIWFFLFAIGTSGSGTPNILALRPPGGAKTLKQRDLWKDLKKKIIYRIDGWSLEKFDIMKKNFLDEQRNDLEKKQLLNHVHDVSVLFSQFSKDIS